MSVGLLWDRSLHQTLFLLGFETIDYLLSRVPPAAAAAAAGEWELDNGYIKDQLNSKVKISREERTFLSSSYPFQFLGMAGNRLIRVERRLILSQRLSVVFLRFYGFFSFNAGAR